MKRAYVFPGQGAQFPGMGKELYDRHQGARELMEEADRLLGFRITDIMFEGSEDQLRATDVTQPAVFLHSVCLALCSGLESPDMVGGHSLGEFSALVVSGAIGFQDGLMLVAARAAAMQKCCEKTPGSMAAIVGLDEDTIVRICQETPGCVIPANFNSEGQIVISGETASVQAACAALKDAGAKRALPLNVGGAFHSPLMKEAQTELSEAINSIRFNTPRCPIYQNVSAKAETVPDIIKCNLLLQLTSPVLWTQSVKAMLSDGASDFTEIGPGRTLQGLIKRIAGPEITINGIN